MQRSSSSRSKRRCRRTVAPAAARGEQVEQPEDVRRRRGHLEPVFVRQPQGQAPVLGGQGDGAVGVAHRLGAVGGAGAEHEDGVIALVHGSIGWPGGARPVDDRRGVRRIEVEHGGGTQLVDQQGHGGTVGHGAARSGQAERRLHLAGLPGRVQKHRGGAQPAGGLHDHHELGPVRRHHGHAVPRSDAQGDEMPRHGVGCPIQFGKGPAIVARQDGDLIGKAERGRLEPAMHEARGHGNNLLRIEIRRQHD